MPACSRFQQTRQRFVLAVVALILVGGCDGDADVSTQEDQAQSPRVVDADVAFMGVSLIPMTAETVFSGQNVLIRDDVIVAIGPPDEVVPADGAMLVV